jgi:hypothetical protein
LILLLVWLFAMWSRQGVALEGSHLGWSWLARAPWPVVGIEEVFRLYDNTTLLAVEAVTPPTCGLGGVLMFTGKDGGRVTACHVGKLIEEKPGACAGSMMSSVEKRAIREVWAKEVYRLCTLKDWIRMNAERLPGYERL